MVYLTDNFSVGGIFIPKRYPPDVLIYPSGFHSKPARRLLKFGRRHRLIKKEHIEEYIKRLIQSPIAIYSLDIKNRGSHQLIEISLDNLENKFGAVSLGTCEDLARNLQDVLEKEHPEADYTLQVSSPGAERALRLPDDIRRFSHLPMKLSFHQEDKIRTETVRVLKIDGELLEAEIFSKKKVGSKSTLNIRLDDIKKGNLYLDI